MTLEVNKSIHAALLSPKATDEFLTQYWPKRPFLAQVEPARWPAVLRSEELASVLKLARLYRSCLLCQNGKNLGSRKV